MKFFFLLALFLSGCTHIDPGKLYLQTVMFPPTMVMWGIASIPGDAELEHGELVLPVQYRR
jgi:hypothetical protein